jgi:hypothetical protein
VTVTLSPGGGPALDPRTELGVHIIKLPSRAAVAATLGCDPSHPDVLAAAAKLTGPARKADIIVFDGKPWHMVNAVLLPHPQAHLIDKETVLKVSFAAQQRVTWWSREHFTIEDIERSSHHPAVAGSAARPFDGPDPPYDAAPLQGGVLGTVWLVQARPIVKAAIGQQYKITFRMGELIDPDMEGVP